MSGLLSGRSDHRCCVRWYFVDDVLFFRVGSVRLKTGCHGNVIQSALPPSTMETHGLFVVCVRCCAAARGDGYGLPEMEEMREVGCFDATKLLMPNMNRGVCSTSILWGSKKKNETSADKGGREGTERRENAGKWMKMDETGKQKERRMTGKERKGTERK